MKVYVAMINDRHTEPEPYVFTTVEDAIAYARKAALEYCRYADDFDESETPGGWLYYARYSCESDCVWVVEKDLQEIRVG